MRYRSLLALGLAVGVVFVSATAAQHEDNDAAIFRLADLKWQDGPDALPKGAKIAILEGNPSKPGPFVFRVKVPDGYRVPSHTHPSPERITVISGTFYLGMGKTFDETKGKPMPAGTYGQWPAGMTHYVWTKGETVLQFHGTGPWTIRYLNPADDPRTAAKR